MINPPMIWPGRGEALKYLALLRFAGKPEPGFYIRKDNGYGRIVDVRYEYSQLNEQKQQEFWTTFRSYVIFRLEGVFGDG